mgnify:FL=1
MKKNLNDFKRLLLTACCTLVLSCGWATVNEKPFVIPELKQWSGAEGMFTPSGKYPPFTSVASCVISPWQVPAYLRQRRLHQRFPRPSSSRLHLPWKPRHAEHRIHLQ